MCLLHVKTSSRRSRLLGFKRSPAAFEKLGNKKTDFGPDAEDFVDRDQPKRVTCPSLTSLTYLAKLTGWRAAAVDSMAFEVEQRFHHRIALSACFPIGTGITVLRGPGGRRRRTLKCRAGQTQEVRRTNEKGLQSYIR